METNKEKKKPAVRKSPVKSNRVETDPFATEVEVIAQKKPSINKTVKGKAVVDSAKKSSKKSVTVASKTIISDPFAEIVDSSSPVQKPTAKVADSGAKPTRTSTKSKSLDATSEIAGSAPKVELSPTFKALADVSLPTLQRENRARLQMQTPTRLYLYWSVKENPWALLRKVFGDDLGSYTLVVKLIDTKQDREEIQQCDAEGNWWFDVEPNHSYRAEIGFYAPNRPYFRILHSNTVETPRRSPSPHSASEAKWTVSANKFAQVLDVAGFSRDAFDVAMAGDDQLSAENASHRAFSTFLDVSDFGEENISAEDIRFVLVALASGMTLEDLRSKVSPALFAILQANADKLESGRAMNSLTEHFDINETEFIEEQIGSAVYGASVINFPRTLKTRLVSNKFGERHNPISSFSFGR